MLTTKKSAKKKKLRWSRLTWVHPETNAAWLKSCAKCANREHREVLGSVRSALRHAMEAGMWLVSAKTHCSFGTWETWLKENFKASPETARCYMRVWLNHGRLERLSQDNTIVSLEEALARLRVPRAKTKKPYKPHEWTASDMRKAILAVFEAQLSEWTEFQLQELLDWDNLPYCIHELLHVPGPAMTREDLNGYVDPEEYQQSAEALLRRRRKRRRQVA
jgi:hypothetical protein